MTETVSPLRGEWRCSNCGAVAVLDEGYSPLDARYGLGHCGECSLRGRVPLVRGTAKSVNAMIAERQDGELRSEQKVGLRVGSIPAHVYVEGCCEKFKRSEHLTVNRLEQLGWKVGRA